MFYEQNQTKGTKSTNSTRVLTAALTKSSSSAARSQTFDEQSYREQLREDINGAIGRIIFLVPYATVRAVTYWLPSLESAQRRHVTVCVILAEPDHWHERESLPEDLRSKMRPLEAAIKLLESKGVHVTLRRGFHEKLIVIDDCILWEGSLNYLSHFQTTERLRRWFDRCEVERALVKHNMLECNQCEIHANLWEQLSAERQAQGLSQHDLAKNANTTRRLIYEAERGERNITFETLQRIVTAMNLDVVVVPKYLAGAVRSFARACLKVASLRGKK